MHWPAIQELFERAIALEPPEREAFVVRECKGDEELRREVSRLLVLHQDSSGFMDEALPVVLAMAGGGAGELQLPSQLGDFRLVRRLGGGGMGVVFLAVQESLGREVALKLIRSEQLLFEGTRARFRREVEAVARMQHPGIVPIHTVGEQDGVPFYAMELVQGRTLAEIASALQGSAPEDLDGAALGHPGRGWVEASFEIVRQVAQALQHAHERGVVHRDVKPSNVMVTAEGRALLLDFGIAMQEGSDRLTRSGAQPGSLAYMSPEQMRGEALDARTDVYSLGATLYELLGLRPAFSGDTQEELRRRILSGETDGLRRFNRRVAWDAETVCRVAMAPEPGRRYASAAAFAGDLEAFLSHRPIAARRPGPWLRLRRWVQRRPALSTGLALGVLLAVGLPTSLYLNELSAGTRIRREAESHRLLLEFFLDLFAEVSPDQARGETVPVRVVLDRGVRRIQQELATEPYIKARLLETMGRVYEALGLADAAQPLLADAIDLHLRELGGDSLAVANLHRQLGTVEMHRGDLATSERVLREALAAIAAAKPGDDATKAETMILLAEPLRRSGNDDEARSLLEAALAMQRRIHGGDHLDVEFALVHYGGFLNDCDHPSKATPYLREALQMVERLVAADHPRRVMRLCNLAVNLCVLGEVREAEQLMREALRVAEGSLDADHPALAMVRERYAGLLAEEARDAEARPLLDQALDAYRRIHVRPHLWLAHALNLDGILRAHAGDLRGSVASYEQAVGIHEKVHANGHPDFARVLCNLAQACTERGDLAYAEQTVQRAIEMLRAPGSGRQDVLPQARRTLALVLALRGNLTEAEQQAREAVELARAWFRGEHCEILYALRTLADVLLLRQAGAAAEPVVRDALAMSRRLRTEPHAVIAMFLFQLGWSRHQQGDLEGARELQEQSLEMFRAVLPAGHQTLGLPLNDLGVVLAKLKRLEEAEARLTEAVDVRKVLEPRTLPAILSSMNLAQVSEMRGKPEQAELHAWQSLAGLRAAANPRDFKNAACVQLLLKLLARADRTPEPAELERLHEAAAALLPEGHALRKKVEDLRDAAARRQN